MQVGDLVTYSFQLPRWRKGESVHVGLVIETGKYAGNCDCKVLWAGHANPTTESWVHLSLAPGGTK